jgi:amino acid permease
MILQHKFLYGLATLVSTILGVGTFAFPYALSQTGFIFGIFLVIILAIVVTYLHLIFGEIVLRTKEKHCLPGYVRTYSPALEPLVKVTTFIDSISVLIIYLFVGSAFLAQLVPFLSGNNEALIVFWLVTSLLLAVNLRTFAFSELIMTFFLIFAIFIIFFASLPEIDTTNLLRFEVKNLIIPYGIIFFSFMGRSAIPEIRMILAGEEKKIHKVIIWSTIIITFVYLIFSIAIIGISKGAVPELATDNIREFFPAQLTLLVYFLGIISILTSQISLARYLKESFVFDYKFNKTLSFLIITLLPIIFVLSGLRDFISIMVFVGTIFGGLEGLIMIFIYMRAKKLNTREPEYSLKISPIMLGGIASILIFGIISAVIAYI